MCQEGLTGGIPEGCTREGTHRNARCGMVQVEEGRSGSEKRRPRGMLSEGTRNARPLTSAYANAATAPTSRSAAPAARKGKEKGRGRHRGLWMAG